MMLMTKKVIKNLPALYSQGKVADPICRLKFFTPDADWTWYITEGKEEYEGDWLFFCKVVNTMCPEGELGYVRLSELKEIRGGLGLPIERDMHFREIPLSECK